MAELRKSVPTAQNRSLQLLDLWARVGSGWGSRAKKRVPLVSLTASGLHFGCRQLAVRPKDWHLRVESFRSLARRLLHSLD